MELELWYDPVQPETYVNLNGYLADRGDIYGFLYPVRRCLLQAWVIPTGSWNGLATQLLELARGEEIKLRFHGRNEDFGDMYEALCHMEQLKLSFNEWDTISLWKDRLDQAEKHLNSMLTQQIEDVESGDRNDKRGLFPDEAAQVSKLLSEGEDEWMDTVESEADFFDACQQNGTCCLIKAPFLDSFERLTQLEQLTRSLRRTPDMLCCLLPAVEEQSAFAQHAAQFPRMKYRFFAAPLLENWSLPLWEKYGIPFELRRRISRYQDAQRIFQSCFAQADVLRARRVELNKQIQQGTVKKVGILREEESIRQKLYWMRAQEAAMEKLCTLLYGSVLPKEEALV